MQDNPMRKAVICNFKGGVGKTTCAVNIGVGLARAGKKVLLIDNDAQASATDAISTSKSGSTGTYGLIVNSEAPSKVAAKIEKNFSLIPASRALAQVDQWLTTKIRREEILKKRLEGLKGYDFVIIDTAPSFSLLNLNALTYAEEVWIPASMEYLSLQGVKQVIDSLNMIREELDHELAIRYVIPTFYDMRNSKTKSVIKALKESFGKVVTTPVRTNVKLSEAPSHHISIFDYAPASAGAEDFEKLVKRIVKDG
ncbi:ParA family protein [bacterium]|nr:ParA family protein [bacterium]